MDRLTSIEVFTRAVDFGSFAGAARACGLSAGMVGKHIRALEAKLGVRLLNRTTRRISLTEPGRAYYERCQRILADIEQADIEATEHLTAPGGVIRVNAPIAFGELHLARAIAQFTARHSAVRVDVVLNNYQVDLLDNNCDVAIRIGQLPDSDLIARRLAPCHRVICASPAYLERHGTPRQPEDLKHHDCLLHLPDGDATAWKFKSATGEISIAVNGSVHSDSGTFLRAVALAGSGVVRLPSFIVGSDIINGDLVPLLTDYIDADLGIHAVFLGASPLCAKLRAFVNFLIGYFGAEPPWHMRASLEIGKTYGSVVPTIAAAEFPLSRT